MKHGGRIAKKRELAYGWRLLLAGNETRADRVANEVLDSLPAKRKGDMTAQEMQDHVQKVFLNVRKRAMHSGELEKNDEFDLKLLLAGFDEKNKARCFVIHDTGLVQDIQTFGYAAIGKGCDAAESTLGLYRVPMRDPLARVLYKVFEAKRRAELIASVGAKTDIWIVTEQAHRQAIRHQTMNWMRGSATVPPSVLASLDRVYDWVRTPPWRARSKPRWGRAIEWYATRVLRGEAAR